MTLPGYGRLAEVFDQGGRPGVAGLQGYWHFSASRALLLSEVIGHAKLA
jgi:hypothetical protein